MLVFHIILAIIVVIAVIIFAVKTANLNNQIEDIYAKQAILHETYCACDRYISALNEKHHEYAGSIDKIKSDIKSLHLRLDDICTEIDVLRDEVHKEIARPAIDPRQTRDVKQTAAENRKRFAELRKTMSVQDSAKELGVSLTTAKRYEKWCKEQEICN